MEDEKKLKQGILKLKVGFVTNVYIINGQQKSITRKSRSAMECGSSVFGFT